MDEEMRELRKALGSILDRLTAIETTIGHRSDFEQRIRELEYKQVEIQTELRNKTKVLSTVAGTIAGVIASVISALLVWHFKG